MSLREILVVCDLSLPIPAGHRRTDETSRKQNYCHQRFLNLNIVLLRSCQLRSCVSHWVTLLRKTGTQPGFGCTSHNHNFFAYIVKLLNSAQISRAFMSGKAFSCAGNQWFGLVFPVFHRSARLYTKGDSGIHIPFREDLKV